MFKFKWLSQAQRGVSVPVCSLGRGLRCRRRQPLGVLRPGGRVSVWRWPQQLRVGLLRR